MTQLQVNLIENIMHHSGVIMVKTKDPEMMIFFRI